jgi:hypothetical protein
VRSARLGLVLLGLAVAAYGGWLLLRLGWDNLVATLPWLVVAVLLHDFVWMPVVLLAAAAGAARLPRTWGVPATVGAVVLVSVTVAVLPTITRVGARPDNPSLLDRPYVEGWLLFAATVAVGVVAGGLLRGRRARRADTPGLPR